MKVVTRISTVATSSLDTWPTITIRLVQGTSIMIPYDVDKECKRRENLEANGHRTRWPVSTSNTDLERGSSW